MYRLLENKMAHHDISVLRSLCMKHVLNCKNWIFISTNTIFFGVRSTQFTLIHAYVYIHPLYIYKCFLLCTYTTDRQSDICRLWCWVMVTFKRTKQFRPSVPLCHFCSCCCFCCLKWTISRIVHFETETYEHETKTNSTKSKPSRGESSQVEPKRYEPKQHNNNNKKLYNNNNNYRKKENYFKVLSNHLKHSLSDRPTDQPNDGQRNEQSTMK